MWKHSGYFLEKKLAVTNKCNGFNGAAHPLCGNKPWGGLLVFVCGINLQKVLIGFAAGVMVVATVWSLLIPALEQSAQLGQWSFVPAAVGFWLGILFLLVLDRAVPYMHLDNTAEDPHANLKRTTMLVLTVTLHNIPEDMAVGVVYAGWVSGTAGITAAALALAIQNFPEGAIISMPLWAEGRSEPHAFWYGVASGVGTHCGRAERAGGGAGNACSAVSAQLCRRCYDIRFGGRACSGNGGG